MKRRFSRLRLAGALPSAALTTQLILGFFSPPAAATDTASISLSSLAAMLPSPQLFATPARQFRLDDPLGVSGIDAINAWAEISGDTLRIFNLKLGGEPYSADFRLSSSSAVAFGLSGATVESSISMPAGTPIAGIETTSMMANLVGPPLRLSLVPLKLSGQDYVASFLFNTANAKFEFEGASVLPPVSLATTRGL